MYIYEHVYDLNILGNSIENGETESNSPDR